MHFNDNLLHYNLRIKRKTHEDKLFLDTMT